MTKQKKPLRTALKTVGADTIRAGDAFLHSDGSMAWHAVSDARTGYVPNKRGATAEPGVAIDVQHHPDGGYETRWFPADMVWSAHMVRRAAAEPETAAWYRVTIVHGENSGLALALALALAVALVVLARQRRA